MAQLNTITVAELIERLRCEDQDALVIFSTDYGDRCHTQQALPLRGEMEEVSIKRSGYSESGFAVVADRDGEEDEENADGDGGQKYLVIS